MTDAQTAYTRRTRRTCSSWPTNPRREKGYQRAIKQTVRQHFVAGLHSDIKAQISMKLQSLYTKEKLLTAAAEIEAAVRPKNAAAALMSVDHMPSTESDRIREMQREIDAIRSRFGNLNIQQGGGARRKQRRTGKEPIRCTFAPSSP